MKLGVMATSLSLLASLSFSLTALAASPNISHAYYSLGSVQTGDLVSLDSSKSNYVEPASTSNASRLLGVVVANNNSLIAINSGANTVQVATNGQVEALVSNVDGNIEPGNQISVSNFEGIGMKADSGSHIMGLAVNAFSGSTKGAISEQVKNNSGETTTVKVGYIPINIAVGTTTSSGSSYNGLEKLAVNLTGHPIPTYRIVIALVIAVIAIIQLFASTYVSIYGSIVSIGRNPLAKREILHTLTSVVITTLLTAAVACVAILLLLR